MIKLILGHPDHIHCEPSIDTHTFKEVTLELHSHGHKCSTKVFLEEQLMMFLYTCVTGLPIRHIGEQFQRFNDMISRYVCTLIYSLFNMSMLRYFHKMVKIFALEPFHSKYISLASSITNIVCNYHFSLTLRMPLVPLMAAISLLPSHFIIIMLHIITTRALCCRTVCLHVILT